MNIQKNTVVWGVESWTIQGCTRAQFDFSSYERSLPRSEGWFLHHICSMSVKDIGIWGVHVWGLPIYLFWKTSLFRRLQIVLGSAFQGPRLSKEYVFEIFQWLSSPLKLKVTTLFTCCVFYPLFLFRSSFTTRRRESSFVQNFPLCVQFFSHSYDLLGSCRWYLYGVHIYLYVLLFF